MVPDRRDVPRSGTEEMNANARRPAVRSERRGGFRETDPDLRREVDAHTRPDHHLPGAVSRGALAPGGARAAIAQRQRTELHRYTASRAVRRVTGSGERRRCPACEPTV